MSSLNRILNHSGDDSSSDTRRGCDSSSHSCLSSPQSPVRRKSMRQKDALPAAAPKDFVHKEHPNCPTSFNCLPDCDERPQHTLPVMLRCAILGSPNQRLTIRGIYTAMEDKYPYYKTAGPAWKQSVRHHLSLNRIFERIPRPPADPGFGSYWTVNLSASPGTKRPRKRGRQEGAKDKPKEPAKKRAKVAEEPSIEVEETIDPQLVESPTVDLLRMSAEPAEFMHAPLLPESEGSRSHRFPPEETSMNPQDIHESSLFTDHRYAGDMHEHSYRQPSAVPPSDPRVARVARGIESDDELQSEDSRRHHHHNPPIHSPMRYNMTSERDAEQPSSFGLGPAAFGSDSYDHDPFSPSLHSPAHPLGLSHSNYSLSPIQHHQHLHPMRPHSDTMAHFGRPPISDEEFETLERELEYLRSQLDTMSLESNRLSTQLYEARAEASRLRRLHQVSESRLREELAVRQRLEGSLQEEVKRRKAAEKHLRDMRTRQEANAPALHSR